MSFSTPSPFLPSYFSPPPSLSFFTGLERVLIGIYGVCLCFCRQSTSKSHALLPGNHEQTPFLLPTHNAPLPPNHPRLYPLPICLPALHPLLGQELQHRPNCTNCCHFKGFKAQFSGLTPDTQHRMARFRLTALSC